MDRIVIKGAREHNLKGIDLELPKNSLIVITGVSGSGKSSLAFDTIYAEGERRYVESLSAYARQFLEKMDKPDVESIEGLSPSISIEQRTISKNPRSTVGTVTEVYDYLRLLFTTLGTPHCYRCGRAITTQSIQQMTERLLELPQGTKLTVFSPIVRGRKGEYRKELAALRRDGYTKARIDGKMVELIEVDGLDKRKKHYIDVVIDRLVVKEGVGLRLSDALELATGLSGGIAKVETSEGREFFFNEKLSCIECGISYPEITLTTFSFNSPHGACPECKGLGEKTSFDPSLVVPDQELSLIDGAIAPWNKKTEKKPTALYEDIILSLSRHYGFAPETPFRKLPKKVRDAILFGTEEEIEFIYRKGGRRYSFFEPFE
ncbi:MAG TPA: excinuclease ABC subunit UvrA, partial [Deltaproteobacteria bacterium]|nr:excinuclease ABC subunit UvrA [Deltaproteobacteria bacterium]